MRDFLHHCLISYYQLIDWPDDFSYSKLSNISNEILDFEIPNHYMIALGKSITPKLKGVYSLGIVPQEKSCGFLFTSLDHDTYVGTHFYGQRPEQQSKQLLTQMELESPVHSFRDVKDFNWRSGSPDLNLFFNTAKNPNSLFINPNHSPQKVTSSLKHQQPYMNSDVNTMDATNPHHPPVYPYALYGRIHENGKLETIISKKWSAKSMLTAATLTHFRSNTGEASLQFSRRTKNTSYEFMYLTQDTVVGMSFLQRLQKSCWSIGGEIYYTHKEKSGGLSIGSKYHHITRSGIQSIITFVSNPMMGHIETAYAAHLHPYIMMATRYKFNMYSYESDLSLGVEYAPPHTKTILKAKLSFTEGLGLKLEGKYHQMLFAIGMFTDFSPLPRRSLGLEIQIS